MLKRVMGVNTSLWEFLVKFPLSLFIIMPGCMGGAFWIGYQIDAAANIHFLKFIFPFLGTFLGLYVTGLLIMLGHSKQSASETAKEADKPYSDTLVSKPYEYSDTSHSPKASIPRAGYATPFTLGGKFIK
ncbi:MAG: hypothetical protein ABSG90_04290 [Dehalococcoidia bacterium]|jgi:hypothetical protein